MRFDQRSTPVIVTVGGALLTAAVIVTAWRGHSAIAVLLSLSGVLLTSYLVRNRVRARLIYARGPNATDNRPDQLRRADTVVSVDIPPQAGQPPRGG